MTIPPAPTSPQLLIHGATTTTSSPFRVSTAAMTFHLEVTGQSRFTLQLRSGPDFTLSQSYTSDPGAQLMNIDISAYRGQVVQLALTTEGTTDTTI